MPARGVSYIYDDLFCSPPSNILTAVGKSLTRRAALRAAMITPGEGTRSYANALFRFLCIMLSHICAKTALQRHLPAAQTRLAPCQTQTRICYGPVSACSSSLPRLILLRKWCDCNEFLLIQENLSQDVVAYLCENSSYVSSPCSELLCTADELNGDLAQIEVVVGATREALGAALTTGRNNDIEGRAAARRKLRAILCLFGQEQGRDAVGCFVYTLLNLLSVYVWMSFPYKIQRYIT